MVRIRAVIGDDALYGKSTLLKGGAEEEPWEEPGVRGIARRSLKCFFEASYIYAVDSQRLTQICVLEYDE